MMKPNDDVLKKALQRLRTLWTAYPEIDTPEIVALGTWLAKGAPGSTLVDERFQLREQLKTGESVTCPCCQQTAKVYKRTIHSGMAMQIIRIWKAGRSRAGGWVPVDEIYAHGSSGDYAKLRFWGLVEAEDARSATANASGHWRVTDLGIDFVLGKLAVARYVHVYNNEVVAKTRSETLTIQQALGSKFNYADLMT